MLDSIINLMAFKQDEREKSARCTCERHEDRTVGTGLTKKAEGRSVLTRSVATHDIVTSVFPVH